VVAIVALAMAFGGRGSEPPAPDVGRGARERQAARADRGKEPAPKARPAEPADPPQVDAMTLQLALRRAASPSPAAEPGAAPAECTDSREECAAWAAAGECEANAAFMHAGCPASCNRCPSKGPAAGPDTWLLPDVPLDWPALESAAAAHPAALEEARACGAETFLSERPIPGLHVVCGLSPGADPSLARLAVWRDADAGPSRTRGPSATIALPLGPREGIPELSVAEVTNAVAARLAFRWRGDQWQAPNWFTCVGDRLLSPAALRAALAEGPVCLFEGGQFVWPPGVPGTERKVTLLDGRTSTIVTLSVQPVVLSVDNFLLPDEAEHMVGRAEPHLKKSGVALKDADRGKEAKEFRTSSQYFLGTDGDARLEDIDARVQWLMRVPITHAEYIQVLRYEHMEHYSAHHDYFDPRDYAKDPRMQSETRGGAKNRLATVFFYLSDVAEGGATNFPRAGGGPPPRDFFDCSKGLSVFPRKGRVIVFYSMHPSSELDPYSLHGGCDVVNGTKMSANFWLWNMPYHFASAQRVRAFDEFKRRSWRS